MDFLLHNNLNRLRDQLAEQKHLGHKLPFKGLFEVLLVLTAVNTLLLVWLVAHV